MRTLPCFLFCKITTLLGEMKCTDGLATTASYSLQKKKRERYYCNHSLVTPHAERPKTVASTDPFFECIRDCLTYRPSYQFGSQDQTDHWLDQCLLQSPKEEPLYPNPPVIVLFLQLLESQEPNRAGHGQSKSLQERNETTVRSWLRPGHRITSAATAEDHCNVPPP